MTTTGPSADLDLLRLADPVATPPRPTPDDVARVVAAARTRAGHPAPRPARRTRRPRRRLALTVAGVAVAAAAASVALVVLPGGERVGVRPPAAAADPVAILRAAATTAAAQPFTPPRADQFVYLDLGGGARMWRSVDGTRDGRSDGPSGSTTLPGCHDGVALVEGNYPSVRPQPCIPEPAYRADIPTDPTALQAWLVVQGNGSETNNVAKQVLYLLQQTLLAPEVRAALFTAVSTYPGLTLGTAGLPPNTVGVSWSFGGGTMTLVFDAADHAYRGVLGPGGDVDGEDVPVVVDAVGQTR